MFSVVVMHVKESVEELKKALWDSMKCFPGTLGIAKALKEKGIAIGILSNHATEVLYFSFFS